MNKRRVAITGLGIVSPLGNDVETTWDRLMAGQSGIDVIQQFDANAFPTRIAAEVRQFSLRPSLKNAGQSFCHFIYGLCS
jgi:3-oxoacyl-[acyl-carrier-protein] synthase II